MTDRLIDPVQPGQRRAHLTELDAIAADLDLPIGTPQILQLPVSTPTHQTPGAIHPRPRRPNGHATNRDPVNPPRRT